MKMLFLCDFCTVWLEITYIIFKPAVVWRPSSKSDTPHLEEIKSTLADNKGNTQNTYTRKSSCPAGINPGELSEHFQPNAPLWAQTLWSVVCLQQSCIVPLIEFSLL